MELKKDIITACLLFRENNYSFPYSSFVTTTFGDIDQRHKNKLYKEFGNCNLFDFVECLANNFHITIHFVYDDHTIRSREYGKELFMRKNEYLFWFHSNCGRMVNLPSGVNKLQGPCHRLDEILGQCEVKKCKITKCPLRYNTDLDVLEKEHGVTFRIWQKTRKDKTYAIKNIRRGNNGGPVINLHHDPIFNKLFLITAKSLYFRSFIRKLNIHD